MTGPTPPRPPRPPGPGRIAGLLALARGALFWERLWPALWPLTGVIGLFLALALVDVLPRLPCWLHIVLLLAIGLAAGAPDWSQRLQRAVMPEIGAFAAPPPAHFDI